VSTYNVTVWGAPVDMPATDAFQCDINLILSHAGTDAILLKKY